ncbi:MAG: cytochrome oxidase, partial [Chromatiaceae bacterium]|nr:cytochrome oxidase [Chromatiaceae bacterium]
MAVTSSRTASSDRITLGAVGTLTALGTFLWAGAASAELGINFPKPAAGVAQEIYDIHMLTTTIATVLLVIIFGFVTYSLIHHRKSRGYVADQ